MAKAASKVGIKATDLLRAIIEHKDCERMTKSHVIAYLGELLVKEKLINEGIAVEHKGKRCGCDLLCCINGKQIKIDVKASTLKDEIKGRKEHWGWALSKSEKSKIKCSHYVCVALDKNSNAENFYIINAKDIRNFPKGIGEYYKKVKRAFIQFPRGKQDISILEKKGIDKKWLKIIKRSQFLLDKKKAMKVNRSLTKILSSF